MLVVVQHPLVDVRPLISAETHRTRAPLWPRPLHVYSPESLDAPRNDFVRSVGRVRRRMRGNPSPWLNEGYFVDARRICGDNQSSTYAGQLKPVFRRLYHDGIVARLESGFLHSTADRWSFWRPEGPAATADVVKAVLGVSTWFGGQTAQAAPLVDFGPMLARNLLASTTRRPGQAGTPRVVPPSWWLVAGSPAVIVEDRAEYRGREDEATVRHIWQIVKGQRVSVCTIAAPAYGAADTVRRLRVHLSHLTSELAALEIVLSLCVAGKLDPDHPSLRDYLDSACSRLLRERRDGVPQRDYLTEILDSMHDWYADQIGALRALAESIDSRGLSRKLRDTAALLEQLSGAKIERMNVIMGDSMKTRIEATNVAGVAIGHSKVKTGDIAQDGGSTDLRVLLDRLMAEVVAVRPHVSEDQSDSAEDAVAAIKREAESEEPDREGLQRRLAKLLSISQTAGAAGTALAAAVSAIRAAFGF